MRLCIIGIDDELSHKTNWMALCVMMSLLIVHVSACACSHHVEKKVVEKPSCHSHGETAEMVEAVNDSNVCDADCICFAEQTSPYIEANLVNKNFNAKDTAAPLTSPVSKIEFRAAATYINSLPEFVSNHSYSNTLRSLLPARAPPRL